MKRNLKKAATTILVSTSIILATSNVFAMQTAPGYSALTSTTVNEFFLGIRQMEAEGGSLGLTDTAATFSGITETSPSNGIDSHMIKNTEWGAAAMLTLSDYGAGNINSTYSGNNYTATKSTTGNSYGVYGMYMGLASYEYTAGAILEKCTSSSNSYLKSADSRYVDSYATSTSNSMSAAGDRYILGDGTYETMNISGGGGYFVGSSGYVFHRGSSGVSYANSYTGDSYSSSGSRVCVWSFSGL